MSTRATIRMEGMEHCKVYKHSDGYPEVMLEWLEQFNKAFTEKRGECACAEQKIAQLLRHSVIKFPIKTKDNYQCYTGDNEFLDWAIVEYDEDYNADYEYTLKKDGSVEVMGK